MEIVERRIVKIINAIDRIIDADFQVSARELASFTGRIISTRTVSCTLNHDKGCSAFSFVLVVYVLFLFFQITLATNSWKGFQHFPSINVYEALDVMSRANSSIKAYVRVIRKWLD